MPDTHAAFKFLISIFYEIFFETNIYQADHNPDGHLKIPIQCLMDEFANIGKIPSFERKIAVMRSRWLSTIIILQNFAQGKALYKDDWETIVGNCDSFLFLGGNEKSTTEYVSKILGKQTIQTTDTSISKGRSGSYSKSEKRLARDLLSLDEIGRLDTKKCIYILRGVKPFLANKSTPPNNSAPFTYTPAKTPLKTKSTVSITIEDDEIPAAFDILQENETLVTAAPYFGEIQPINGSAGIPIDPLEIKIHNSENAANISIKANNLSKGLTVTYNPSKSTCTISGIPEEPIENYEAELTMNYQLKL
ncbi:TraG/TraD/VirD4 family protein [Arcanobacterium hippocoleae]